MDYSKCRKWLGVDEKRSSCKVFTCISWALNGISLDENFAGKNPNLIAKGAYPIASLTWILAYEKGNGRNTKAIKQAFNTLLSDEYQDKASSLGFIPLKGNILLKSRAAVEKIGS